MWVKQYTWSWNLINETRRANDVIVIDRWDGSFDNFEFGIIRICLLRANRFKQLRLEYIDCIDSDHPQLKLFARRKWILSEFSCATQIRIKQGNKSHNILCEKPFVAIFGRAIESVILNYYSLDEFSLEHLPTLRIRITDLNLLGWRYETHFVKSKMIRLSINGAPKT